MFNQLRETITKLLSDSALGLVRLRGLLIPLDPWMRGKTRFASKLGGNGSVWRPEIRVTTTQPTGAGGSVLTVDNVWSDLVLDSIIKVNNVRNKVLDFDNTDPVEYTVSMQEPVLTAVELGTLVYLWAFPVTVEGGVSSGTNRIRVSTGYQLARGDRLELPTVGTGSSNWKLTAPLNVSSVDFVEEDTEGFKYILTLEKNLPRDVASDETVYIRAYPAYFSGKVPLPVFGAASLNVVGPFLVDYLSGPLVRDLRFEEFLSVSIKKLDGTPITPLLSVGSHNVQVNRMPIRADQFLFWRTTKGTTNWNGSQVVAQLDSDGLWRHLFRMAPAMDVPGEYAKGAVVPVAKGSLLNNEGFVLSDGTISVGFEFKIDGTYSRASGTVTIDVSTTSSPLEVASKITSAINSSLRGTISLTKASVANNDRLVISDSIQTKTFEFKIDGTYSQASAEYVTVDISLDATDDDAAATLASSLRSNLTGVNAEALGGSTGIVSVVNSQDVWATPSLSSPDNVTAIAVTSFINLGVTAEVVNGVVSLTNKSQGTIGNVTITEDVTNSGFTLSGMSGGGGGVTWYTRIESDGDAQFIVQLHPGDNQITTISAGITTVKIVLAPDAEEVTAIDIKAASDQDSSTPATTIKMGSWELEGSRVRAIDAALVVRTDSEYYGASALYLKPLWPNLSLLRYDMDDHEINSHSLLI